MHKVGADFLKEIAVGNFLKEMILACAMVCLGRRRASETAISFAPGADVSADNAEKLG